jgi:excisionase family DNA binding protein
VEGLSVKEAALQLGIDEKTVRTRIKAGVIPALKVSRPQGYTWHIFPDGLPAHLDAQVDPAPDPGGTQVDPPPTHVDPAPLVQLVEKLHAENTNLAGQLGFVQAQLLEATERIKLLEGPKEPEPRVPWWRRLLR